MNGRHTEALLVAFFMVLAAAIVIVAVVNKIQGVG